MLKIEGSFGQLKKTKKYLQLKVDGGLMKGYEGPSRV
jgi:hypothetical protein